VLVYLFLKPKHLRNLDNKKILLTGVNGQVGHALSSQLLDLNLVTLSRDELDLSDADAIRRVLREVAPDIIINPAAFTAVDKAELEPDLAYAINATAPQVMAEEAAKLGSALIHFSTDYVFDGNQEKAYTENDATNPTNVYGKTKLAGEELIRNVGIPFLILRTSWVYGPHGNNFLKTILRLASEKEHLGIVSDQIGAPTSSLSIASALNQLLRQWDTEESSNTGIYHFTNAGSTSWYGFACEIIKQYNAMHKQPELKTAIHNIKKLSTAEYPTPATRPANSRLDNTKLKQTFDITLPSWQDGLKTVMHSL
jgi:dTDP-4-dehydrorhamnose reductase